MPAPGVCLNILSERNLKDGQGSPNNPEKYLDQDFHRLKQFCLKERVRFVDNLFPPEMKSIGKGSLHREDLQRVVWKRPHELVPNPFYMVKDTSRFDIVQGVLDLEKCSILSLAHQRILCSEWVPSE